MNDLDLSRTLPWAGLALVPVLIGEGVGGGVLVA